MALAIAPYRPAHQPAVRAFNQRLEQGGVRFRFPDHDACADPEDATISHRGFVAVQEDGDVRGGYLVKEQDFWLTGRRARMGYLHLPLSEGLIDRRYGALGVQLIVHALKRQPLLFGLGIGGYEEAFAKVVTALGWKLQSVPFLFKVVRPFRVARGLRALRTTRSRRLLGDLAAWTGAASVGAAVLQRPRGGRVPDADTTTALVPDCHDVADAVWAEYRAPYQLVAWRDRTALAAMYPPNSRDYLRFVARGPHGARGWAIALDTQMSGHKYFGDLRVGTIVDCFGDPACAAAMVGDVSMALARRGVDLVVSNQSSSVWTEAFRQNGFLSARSNFLFAASPALSKALGAHAGTVAACHLTRGDGDGPINL